MKDRFVTFVLDSRLIKHLKVFTDKLEQTKIGGRLLGKSTRKVRKAMGVYSLISAPVYAILIVLIVTGAYQGEYLKEIEAFVYGLFASASGALVYQVYRVFFGIACLVSLL